jgi:hypothetical protein
MYPETKIGVHFLRYVYKGVEKIVTKHLLGGE